MTRELNRLLFVGVTILVAFPSAGFSQAVLSGTAMKERPVVGTVYAATTGAPIAASSIRHRVIFGASADPAVIPRSRFEQTGVAANSWFSFDKVQHVTFGFLFTLGYQYSLVNKLEMSEKRALPVSIVGTAAIGLGKELYDWQYRSRHHFSKGDLIADSVGILLAVGLIVLRPDELAYQLVLLFSSHN